MVTHADKIKKLDLRLEKARLLWAELFPVWNILDRKRVHLTAEIKRLEDERESFLQGQMTLNNLDF